MNKQTCCPIVIFLFVFINYIFNERLVTFTSLKMGVSTVPHMGTVETKFRQKTTYFNELIVENINYL